MRSHQRGKEAVCKTLNAQTATSVSMPSLRVADFNGLTLQLAASQKLGAKDLELGPGKMEIRRPESKFSALQSKLLKLKALISQNFFGQNSLYSMRSFTMVISITFARRIRTVEMAESVETITGRTIKLETVMKLEKPVMLLGS